MLPHVLRWNAQATAERQKQLSIALDRPQLSAGDAVAELVADLGLPGRLRDVGIKEEQLTAIAEEAATEFQRQVWKALLTIPFGETRSYRQIATQIGKPSAVRAVGAANGRNPLSIVAPCHRVIGSTGALTGFAGGLDIKARLLALEGVRSPA